MSAPDVLAVMLKELQDTGAQLDPCDADAREAWMSACGVALSAIKDPHARASQLMAFAIILTVTCLDLPSSVAVRLIHQKQRRQEES